MRHYLWALRPYFRQTAGELILGSIDTALALERGQASAHDVGLAALVFVGGTLLSEGPRMLKRWWLMTANARIRMNIRADAVRGILALPLADLHHTPVGDLMPRVIGDVEVLGVGVSRHRTGASATDVAITLVSRPCTPL